MNIIDYTVISKPAVHDLCIAVRELMEKGWQPQGGMACNSYRETYMQAMVKYEEPK